MENKILVFYIYSRGINASEITDKVNDILEENKDYQFFDIQYLQNYKSTNFAEKNNLFYALIIKKQ